MHWEYNYICFNISMYVLYVWRQHVIHLLCFLILMNESMQLEDQYLEEKNSLERENQPMSPMLLVQGEGAHVISQPPGQCSILLQFMLCNHLIEKKQIRDHVSHYSKHIEAAKQYPNREKNFLRENKDPICLYNKMTWKRIT